MKFKSFFSLFLIGMMMLLMSGPAISAKTDSKKIAKKECKSEGLTGKALKQCVKDKMVSQTSNEDEEPIEEEEEIIIDDQY